MSTFIGVLLFPGVLPGELGRLKVSAFRTSPWIFYSPHQDEKRSAHVGVSSQATAAARSSTSWVLPLFSQSCSSLLPLVIFGPW
jgi:hypothetical protein